MGQADASYANWSNLQTPVDVIGLCIQRNLARSQFLGVGEWSLASDDITVKIPSSLPDPLSVCAVDVAFEYFAV